MDFGARGDVGHRLRERYLALREPDELSGMQSRNRHHERVRVGVADVLGRADDDPARDEPHVLAGLEHLPQPVDGGVGIAAAHALDEGAGGVVVLVVVAVVDDRLLLNALLRGLEVIDDPAPLVRLGGKDAHLQGV